MPVNTEVKGTLARLLATENLTIEHRKVETACFDVENRVLVLPIWKAASTDVYDMLVGHEVGHALYTPADEYDAPRDFVNVLEDARIERMMEVPYPGLKHSFFKGYAELWENDFFAVKHRDLSKIAFIDRINLYFKGCAQVQFSEYEQSIVDRAAVTKTFQDVIDLAKEVYDYAEKQEDDKSEGEDEFPNFNLKDEEDTEFSPAPKNEVNFEQGEDEDGQPQKQPVAEQEVEEGETEENSGGETFDETQSLTERALRENLEDMIDDDAKEWVYLNVPKVNMKDALVDWNKVGEELEYYFYGQAFESEYQQKRYDEDRSYVLNKYEDYKKSAQKSVNYLVKQFEMKKSADQYARAATAKTGVIDTNKLFSYKINEDIFKKVTVIPDGKNHGLIMLLDWSGSMQNVLMDTLKQTYNLVWFCKKVNIPFRVYAFQSGFDRAYDAWDDQKLNDLGVSGDFNLLEFFSSKMNKQKLDKQMGLIWMQSWAMSAWSAIGYNRNLSLGGTPLAEACYYVREAVKDMKTKEKVQKVNVVCLTDGEANPLYYVSPSRYDASEKSCTYLCHQRNKVYILRDPKTGYSRRLGTSPRETTKEIVSFFNEITDYNWIGIRICSKNELSRILTTCVPYEEQEVINKQWSKEKFASIYKKAGFSQSFYIPNKGIGEGTADLEVKQKGEVATRAELGRAFKKHMGSKKTNKTILNAFVEQIA